MENTGPLLSREGKVQETEGTKYCHLPSEFCEMAGLEKGDEAEIEVFEDCVIIHNGGL